MKIKFKKKITAHALNVMDYNPKKVFKITIQKLLIKNNLIRKS